MSERIRSGVPTQAAPAGGPGDARRHWRRASNPSFRRYFPVTKKAVQASSLTCLLALLATLPLWWPQNSRLYVLGLAIVFMIAAMGGTSFNLLAGYAGQVSFGHAAFYGISAYAFARLLDTVHLNYFAAIFAAALVSAVVCVPLGLVLFRVRGPYFALSMLAVAEVLKIIAQAWKPVTNGSSGLLYTTPYSAKDTNYWIALGLLVLCLLLTLVMVRGKVGSYLVAIREDQDVAESLGVRTVFYKLLAFVASAFMMGLAGAFYAAYFAYLEPDVVFDALNVSLYVLVIAIVGGSGTIFGPLLGAVVVGGANQVAVNAFGQANGLVPGILLVLFVLFLPNGIVGGLGRTKEWALGRPRGLAGRGD